MVPGSRPDVISFYHPKDKNYSPRVRFGDNYTGPWKKGKDIGSFEVIASDEALLDGEFFGDIFGAAWTAFPDADSCKIGYTLRYTLDDGSEIKYTMLSPKHIEHTEYIECWLYDDYHRKPHKFYSHLKPGSMKDETLITSIKLTAGRQIGHVTDIWLTAFICASLDDFDAERNYIGETSCTIHILKSGETQGGNKTMFIPAPAMIEGPTWPLASFQYQDTLDIQQPCTLYSPLPSLMTQKV